MAKEGVPSKMPPLEAIVDPRTTALIVIDVQNDFCRSDGACAGVGDDLQVVPRAIERLKVLLGAARKTGMLIVYVRANYDPIVLSPPWKDQLMHRRKFTSGICLADTPGIEFVDGTGPVGAANEVVVTKHRYSAFWGTDIDLILRNRGISTVVITGVATEGCPESTARDAFFQDYRVVTVADCVASFTQDAHRASLKVLERLFGPMVSADRLVEIWSESKLKVAATPGQFTLPAPDEVLGAPGTAVVVINAQNDFCSPRGAADVSGLGIQGIQARIPIIERLVKAARERGALLIHLVSQNNPITGGLGAPAIGKSANGPTLGAQVITVGADSARTFCAENSWGCEPLEELSPQPGDVTISSHRWSGFADTSLDMILRSNGIRNVVIAGFSTTGMVETTVREAATRDYAVWLPADCIANFDVDGDLHQSSLKALGKSFALLVDSTSLLHRSGDSRRLAQG